MLDGWALAIASEMRPHCAHAQGKWATLAKLLHDGARVHDLLAVSGVYLRDYLGAGQQPSAERDQNNVDA